MHSCTQPAECLNNTSTYLYVDFGWPGDFQEYFAPFLRILFSFFFLRIVNTATVLLSIGLSSHPPSS